MSKKENWEIKYEKYKSIIDSKNTVESATEKWKANDEKIRKELAKISDVKSPEYKRMVGEKNKMKREYETEKEMLSKMEVVKGNMGTIERIKAQRDKYQELLDKLLTRQKENKENIAERDRLENDLKDLKEEEQYCIAALKNPNAPEENKAHAAKVLDRKSVV